MLGEAHTLEVLERVIRHPEAKAADAVEALLIATRTNYTRMANNAVIQDSLVTDATCTVRALCDGSLGTSTTNVLDDHGLGRAIARAVQAARAAAVAAASDDEPGFADGKEACEAIEGAYDSRTAELSGGDKAAALEGVFTRTKAARLLLAGSFHTGVNEVALHNSLGLGRYHRGTVADARFNALEGLSPGDSASYAGGFSVRYDDIDPAALVETAIEKTLMGKSPKVLGPGAYDVLLEPTAVAELLEWMGYIGFSSRAVEDGSSFMVDNIDKAITGESVTVLDDGPGSLGRGIPSPFDGEGTARKTLTLLERGIARTGVHDRRSAKRAGCASTGNAMLGEDAFGDTAVPANVVMLGGDKSHDELMSELDEGLWITRFHYVNGMLEPRRAVMTGLTRDGTFQVKGGKVVCGVRNLRFTDSILEAFARIAGLGNALASVPTWWSSLGAVTAPAVLIRGLRFTGTTDE